MEVVEKCLHEGARSFLALVCVLASMLFTTGGAIELKWGAIESSLPSLKMPAPLVVDTVLDQSYLPPPPNDQERHILCRERNGWCPYSERVWLALEVKKIDYDTILIDNMARPSWYSGQTPQLRFVGSDRFEGDSMDLVQKIDNEPRNCCKSLYPEGRVSEIKAAVQLFKTTFPMYTRPSSRAAFLFQSTGEVLCKTEFEKTLKDTEKILEDSYQKWGGAFFCGAEITAADIAWAPFLERYAAQLPLLHKNLYPRDPSKYPRLAAWYNAMETLVPCYHSRVAGDAASWWKVLQQQGFGNAGMAPELISSIPVEYHHGGKERLLKNMRFVAHQYYAKDRPHIADTPYEEAVALCVKNRDAIVKDMLLQNGPSFDNVERKAEDALFALVSHLLASLEETEQTLATGIEEKGKDANDEELKWISTPDSTALALSAADYMVSRICVPRDMGCSTAKCFYDVKKKLESNI